MSDTRRTIEERFYAALLPAIYRIRDHAQGEPLRALLAILEHELLAVRDDTQGLYEDWFIETCQEWVVPYIGDLLGVELQRSLRAEGFTQRAYVANTLRYRRRKGTATVLEQLSRDVTGWPTRAVEYFQRLTTTQHVQHVRLHAPVTASLRGAAELELADGPFGRECHTAEVRSIEKAGGRFNIPNIGLHVWRLRPYPLAQVEARAVQHAGVPAGRYCFDVLGRSGPLFNDPRTETEIVHLAEERDVPARLRRRALHAELQPVVDGRIPAPPDDGWFGIQPVLRVFRVDGDTPREIAPPQLRICTLVSEPDDGATDWPRPASEGEVHVDPETGRLAFPPPAIEAPPDAVLVDYVYAFSADLGGGPYDRRATLPDRFELPRDLPKELLDELLNELQHGVSRTEARVGTEIIHTDLPAAIDAWNLDALAAWTKRQSLERVIVVMDSRSYDADLTRVAGRCIIVPPNSRLRLVAARWPAQLADSTAGSEIRSVGHLDPTGVRPHLRGDIEVLGLADPTNQLPGGALELDGLLIEGALRVLPGELGRLAVRHCTLVPGHGGLVVESTAQLTSAVTPHPFTDRPSSALATNAGLHIELTRAIADGISLTGPVGSLSVTDGIIDAGASSLVAESASVGVVADAPIRTVLEVADADVDAILALLEGVPDVTITWTVADEALSIAGTEANADIRTSTLLGRVELRELEGSESLFVEPVEVRIVQAGCLRYSYTPSSSRTPRRFRCQPDLALAAARAAAADAGDPFTNADIAAISGRVRPMFTSMTPGHPAYCQLTRSTDAGITTGAEDGSEMGAFHMLEQAHRESNLRAALDKYLRFGLDAGVFYAT